jgi:molecular chaperone DnaK (HSP70)
VLDHLARQVPVVIQGACYAPDAVLGAMVHNIVAAAVAGQGEPPGRLTVTHPTRWSRGQIDALIDAVRSAARGSGLQLIPNAVAVAVAIGHALGHPLADGAAVAVLDIGAPGYTKWRWSVVGACRWTCRPRRSSAA